MKGELEKAYLAGFFDGEGCIWLGKASGRRQTRNQPYFLQVAVAQKFPEVLYRFQALWGGKIYSHSPNMFRWFPRAGDIFAFLRDILPYVGEKKAQLIVGLMFRRRQLKKALTPEMAESCYRALQRLKRIPACQHNLAEIRRIFRKETAKFPSQQEF